VNLKLEEEGTQFFTFRLRDTKGESDLANNSQTIAVQVINSTDYILIVSRQTHPDIGALKAAIETNAVLKADVRSELSDTIRLSRYKLVVFYGPDMKLVSDAKLATLSKIGMPLFVVVTSEESAKWVNNKLKMLEFQNLSGLTEATPEPKASFKAFVHTDFDAFFTALPPISVPFAEYVPAKSAEVYLTQQIKDVSTEKPMVLFSKQNQPTGVMVGSGFWRWRLYDFLQNKTQEHFDTWINKMLLYVMQQRNTERFRINIPALSDEGIPVSADAELYNESMERINNVPISIAISDSAKLLFEYQMIPNGDAYHAELGSFSGGSYSYVATTQIGDEKLTRNGKFSVLPLRQESVRSYNDPILMRQLAQLTQGQSITLKQLDQLPELLKQNVNIRPQIKEQNELTDLVHSKILFFLLVILLTAEWGLRKYFGSY
jgi:hypothetical protein